MKYRFFIILAIAILSLPHTLLAQVVTSTPSEQYSGLQKIKTTISDIQTKITTSTVVTKTSAAIGTAKNSVSSYVKKAKAEIEKQKAKVEAYKERAEKYKAKIEKAKEKAQNAINDAKSKVNEVKGKIDEAKDKVNEVKGKIDEAKDKVNEVKGKIDEAKDKVNEVKGTVQNTINKAKNKVDDIKDKVGIDSQSKGENNTEDNTHPSTTQPAGENGGETEASNIAIPELATTKEGVPSDSDKPEIELQEEDKQDTPYQPLRKSFETSRGFGHLRNSEVLAFAAQTDIVTGYTEEDVLIINDEMGKELSLAEVCGLDYKTAAKDGKLTGCLEDLNAIKTAVNVEDEDIAEKIKKYGLNKEEADILLKDDYMNALAVKYLEALNIYNESLDFKDKFIDPIMTSHIKENTNAIRMVKEMQQILGERLNDLKKLHARWLATEMKKKYIEYSFLPDNQKE